VLPYFAAHGEYLAHVQGREAAEDKQTEVIHAQREFAKLSGLDMESRVEALQGAWDFADRNLRVWNGILAELLVRDPQLQSPVDRNDMLRILETLERQGDFGVGRPSVVEAVSEALGYFKKSVAETAKLCAHHDGENHRLRPVFLIRPISGAWTARDSGASFSNAWCARQWWY